MPVGYGSLQRSEFSKYILDSRIGRLAIESANKNVSGAKSREATSLITSPARGIPVATALTITLPVLGISWLSPHPLREKDCLATDYIVQHREETRHRN